MSEPHIDDRPAGGPFQGLTVVEIGQYVVVPVAAMYLAQGGARVIKVEPASGDFYRRAAPIAPMESRHFLAKNRAKESVSLNIGHPATAEVLQSLFAVADVVLTNMSPAALARSGISYEFARAVNPRIIYGVVSAFGHVGPEAQHPGMDVVAQSRSGLLLALGGERDGVPLHSEVQAADFSTASLLLAGVASALYARERTGKGQKVEVSLLGGALALQGNSLHHVDEVDGWRHDFIDHQLPELRTHGATPAEIEACRERMRPDKGIHKSAYRVLRTADGLIAVGAASGAARRAFFAVLGIGPAEGSQLEAVEQIDRVVAARPTADWLTALRSAGVSVAEVRHVEEMLFDEHVEAEGLVVEVEHPTVGTYRTFGVPVRLSATPFDATQPSPSFAADTERILRELGYGDEQVSQLVAAGAVTVGQASSPKRAH